MHEESCRTILIAEDNQDARLMLKVFLESLGYRIVEAENGKQAVRLARDFLPDLILMDLHMPELGGLSALHFIRRQPQLKRVPVIANSADGNLAIELFSNLKTISEGHIEYLPKPINLDALAELVEIVLATPLSID